MCKHGIILIHLLVFIRKVASDDNIQLHSERHRQVNKRVLFIYINSICEVTVLLKGRPNLKFQDFDDFCVIA